MIKKLYSISLIVLILLSCQSKNKINKQYIRVYFNQIINTNRAAEIRISYINKLKDIIEENYTKKIKNDTSSYLCKAYLILKQRNNDKDIKVLLELEKVLTTLKVDPAKEKNIITSNSSSITLVEEEMKKRLKSALLQTEQPEWDSRIYGRWIRNEESFYEQYEFFSDTTFVYTRTANVDRENLITPNYSTILRGNYNISNQNNTLILNHNDDSKNKQIFTYLIDNDQLIIDGKVFTRTDQW